MTPGKYKHGQNDIPIIDDKMYLNNGKNVTKNMGDGSLVFNPEQRKRIAKAKNLKELGEAIIKAEQTWAKYNTD